MCGRRLAEQPGSLDPSSAVFFWEQGNGQSAQTPRPGKAGRRQSLSEEGRGGNPAESGQCPPSEPFMEEGPE